MPSGPRLRNSGGSAQGRGSMRFLLESNDLAANIRNVPEFVERMMRTTMRYYEPQVENYAKLNAPWTDRTSNARNGLIASSGKEGDAHYIVLAHRVPYGIWLEVRFAGKYGIIQPTIDEFGPRVMGTLQKILDRFGE